MIMDRPEHLQIEESLRGFARFPAQRDQADMDQVEVCESSNADGPHLWVGGAEYRGPATAVELTAEAAWRFAEQIMTAVANHYQGDARPPVEARAAELKPDTTDGISDGHHTFGELYDHRRALNVALCRHLPSWRSKAHHPEDAPMFEGSYFIVGIELPTGTISYHYKLSHPDDFRGVPALVWALVGQEVMTRRDVLDALAAVMVPKLDGKDLKLWRFDIHQVLTNLEDLGVAGWESTEPVTPER
jgi:hypothetical protein